MQPKGRIEEYRGYTITPRADKGYDITHCNYPGIIVYRYTKAQAYQFINGVLRKECPFTEE